MTWRRFGAHRVVEPAGALPQAAQVLDPSLPLHDDEILIDVEVLNIDSASFRQIREEVGGSEAAIGGRVMEIVAERGKMQNPVTGSGGMLLGKVAELGSGWSGDQKLRPGMPIATLVSLTLTPLKLKAIRGVNLQRDQVMVSGHAVLWPSSPMVALPDDIDQTLALSALDVAGAPAQVQRMVEPGMRVAILGAGKSGLLSAIAARERLGKSGRLVALDLYEQWMPRATPDVLDAYAQADATQPLDVAAKLVDALGGEADLVVNTTNVQGAEMGAILATRDGGVAYFFNMATSFSRSTLGAEGVGKDVSLLMGNGFAKGHAEVTLDLIRRSELARWWLSGGR